MSTFTGKRYEGWIWSEYLGTDHFIHGGVKSNITDGHDIIRPNILFINHFQVLCCNISRMIITLLKFKKIKIKKILQSFLCHVFPQKCPSMTPKYQKVF